LKKEVKNISILIPIHNRIDITQVGLTSLYESLNNYKLSGSGLLIFSVIIIDDGSKDGSYDWIANNYKEIYLLRGNGKLWWTGSINKGANYAIDNLNSDFLLLWNDDITPNPEYFIIIDKLVNDSLFQNTIIGSKIVCKNSPEKIWSVGGYYNRFSGNFKMMNEIKDHKNSLIECDWQPGMGTLIPVAEIKSLKLKWDALHFPHYHGDSDFTLRCKSKGMRIMTNIDLVINNNTETTGVNKKRNLKDHLESCTSLKSACNIKIDFRFYSRHGIIPFVYFGMLMKYLYYIGGYIRHSLLKL